MDGKGIIGEARRWVKCGRKQRPPRWIGRRKPGENSAGDAPLRGIDGEGVKV